MGGGRAGNLDFSPIPAQAKKEEEQENPLLNPDSGVAISGHPVSKIFCLIYKTSLGTFGRTPTGHTGFKLFFFGRYGTRTPIGPLCCWRERVIEGTRFSRVFWSLLQYRERARVCVAVCNAFVTTQKGLVDHKRSFPASTCRHRQQLLERTCLRKPPLGTVTGRIGKVCDRISRGVW